jgi:hypothetical protein
MGKRRMGQMDQWEPCPAKRSYCMTRSRRGRNSPFTWRGRKSDKDPFSGSLKGEKKDIFWGMGRERPSRDLSFEIAFLHSFKVKSFRYFLK